MMFLQRNQPRPASTSASAPSKKQPQQQQQQQRQKHHHEIETQPPSSPTLRVRFRSINSIEDIHPIPRVADDYDASEVLAVWGNHREEQKHRLRTARQEAQDYFRGKLSDQDTDVEENDNLEDDETTTTNNNNNQGHHQSSTSTNEEAALASSSSATSSFTSIGLTDMVGHGKVEKIEAREAAWEAVLWEQERQWNQIMNGVYTHYNFELLASVYQETSRQAQKKARWQATRLEREIWGNNSTRARTSGGSQQQQQQHRRRQ